MGLLDLPPELLLRISAHLTTEELGSLRLTCKPVETTLFDSFAKEFFIKRQFMIEQYSLQALIDIASHPALSKWLSHVIIGLEAYQTDFNLSLPVTEQYMKAGHLNRQALLEKGQARDMLVEAFSKLPNLRTVGLRDYSAKGRPRDGPNSSWRSYGWSYCGVSQTITYPNGGASAMGSPNTLFPLIIDALARAHAVPGNIEVILRKQSKLAPASFDVFSGYKAPDVAPVLGGLKKLLLTIATSNYWSDGRSSDKDGVTATYLKRFLNHTSNLELLRLNFQPDQALATPVLEWLGHPAPDPPIALPNLTCLDLGMLTVPGPTLVKAIAKWPKLESFNLWKVTLQCANMDELRAEEDGWARLFRNLALALPDTTSIKAVTIGYASQACCSPRNTAHSYFSNTRDEFRIYFSESADAAKAPDSDVDTNKVAYRARYGTNVKDWLKDVAERTTCDKPGFAGDSDDSGSEFHDDDDDENDDEDEDNDGDGDGDGDGDD
ncbi:uncharacterized protein K452DRAFT_258856 [Aplosporella prunicola CBS 121167]|uniref:F-box domain-containing protein n=1 Tax=Aplosporella prunicola CBS 121167 TaxID=1176127 RepID=A0A6A6B034_9PEZI|nr:uncharacterized protein K452DRAFT_258856 [Aplosporella prunicola CBS 121167]KAF2136604.1 hypothetical protein K452DRAFT_258856 [Aplosporella prunicola CBS 121167]